MPPSELAAYGPAVAASFAFLKRTARLADLLPKAIPLPDGAGALLTLCDLHADDAATISLLSRWRADNQTAYPTRFPVTDAGTAAWLRKRLLEVEDRILFLVLDRHGAPVGHLGFANCRNDRGDMEVDNVVRGVPGTQPGIMGQALAVLLEWARTTLGPESLSLRVFADNARAIAFYERAGFRRAELIPLRRHCEGAAESYDAVAPGDARPPDGHFQRMIWGGPGDIAGKMILTAGPSVGEREAYYCWDAARNGWNGRWSGYLSAFERAFAEYIGVDHCLATSSCTGALHLALAALGVGPGDEVIVPETTWVATAHAVRYVGATPVFADVEEDTWCLDPEAFAAAITPRTAAVVPVHLYGHPARMDRIVAIARKHGLAVVEDAAPAIGAAWQGRRTGTWGDFACFSFQGAKLLVTGEGGALVTNDAALRAKAQKLWDQGRDPARAFWIDSEGFKYKMSNVQAALGLAQIERCDRQIELKRRLFAWYRAGLAGCPHLDLVPEVDGARSVYWMTNVRLRPGAPLGREALRAELKRRAIDSRPAFPPISQYPIWPGPRAPGRRAAAIGEEGVNLPSGVCLHREQVDHVCRQIRQILGG